MRTKLVYLRLNFSWKSKALNVREPKLSTSYKKSVAVIFQSMNVIFLTWKSLSDFKSSPSPHYKTNLPPFLASHPISSKNFPSPITAIFEESHPPSSWRGFELWTTIYKTFVRPHLDYGVALLETIQYITFLALTGTIRGNSREKLYQELGLKSLLHWH